jgi:uncharacterized protein YjbJ (UPF0337 family)
MIRDPSDGSVRSSEAEQWETVEQLQAEVARQDPKAGFSDADRAAISGLRQPVRTDAQERLERSRKWLKDYQEKRNARGSNEQAAGDVQDRGGG